MISFDEGLGIPGFLPLLYLKLSPAFKLATRIELGIRLVLISAVLKRSVPILLAKNSLHVCETDRFRKFSRLSKGWGEKNFIANFQASTLVVHAIIINKSLIPSRFIC